MTTAQHLRIIVVCILLAALPACRREDAAAKKPRRDDRGAEWITITKPEADAEPAVAQQDSPSTPPARKSKDRDAPAPQQPRNTLAPLQDAAAGEWARYRTADGWSQQYAVLGEEAGRVLVEVRVAADGVLVGLPTVRREPPMLDWAVDRAAARKATVVARPERLRAAGRDWDCRLSVATWTRDDDTYEQRVWMSAAAPVYGLVRMELTCTTTGERVALLELESAGPAAP